MKNLLYIISVVSALLLTGCKIDDIDRYKVEDSSIYFQSNNKEVSFLDTPDADYLDVVLPVILVGPTVDYDREISYSIIDSTTTATPQQYQILDSKVGAGEYSGAITVRVMNEGEILEEGTLELELKLESNDQLAVDIRALQYTYQPYPTAKVTWTNQIVMPEWLYYKGFIKFISYTALYRDDQYLYGEQNEEGTRILTSSKYVSNGLYSRNLMKILREIWPDKLNVYGYLGLDEETVAKYPYIYVSNDPYFALLIHQLETYIFEYNQAHPDAPLRHSDDAACINSTGSIPTVSVGGVPYKLEIKGNPPIKVNPYAL